jgi:hypothetical protein
MSMASFVQRMVGAAMLDPAAYEEVEHDRSATAQAAMVVVLSAIAGGIGASGGGDRAVVGAVLMALLQWVMWCIVTYAVGTGVFRGTATPGELLRTVGFAQTPGIFMALAGLPLLGGLIRFAVGIWILVAVVIAIRQALDVSTGKAVLTAILGAVVIFGILMTLLTLLVGSVMAVIGLLSFL